MTTFQDGGEHLAGAIDGCDDRSEEGCGPYSDRRVGATARPTPRGCGLSGVWRLRAGRERRVALLPGAVGQAGGDGLFHGILWPDGLLADGLFGPGRPAHRLGQRELYDGA